MIKLIAVTAALLASTSAFASGRIIHAPENCSNRIVNMWGQCMSTVMAIRRETKTWRWPAFVVAYTYVVAYAAAFCVYQGTAWLVP